MRIGVITFWQSHDNYGQLLQAYSLQYLLRAKGHQAFIIRYGFHEYLHPRLSFASLFTTEGRLNIKIHIWNILHNTQRNNDLDQRGFDQFRKTYLKQSKEVYNSLEDLQKRPPAADCYIAGSDQIWAQLLSRNDNRAFFLDFGDKSIRRVSYAASFALSDYPTELKSQLKQLLSRFDAISVREPNGVKICSSVGINAELVLDPTLLLDVHLYRTLALRKHRKENTPYCFAYHVNVLSAESFYWSEINKYNRSVDLPTIAAFGNAQKDCKMEILDDATYRYPSIEEWISLIDNATYVVTSSFHGTVFAILLHKPFIFCPLPEARFSANDRSEALLQSLGLSGQTINREFSVSQMIDRNIDWSIVDAKLSRLKEKSLDFLFSNLSD